jgi:3-deoxy-7-phosphoheptulonate synthase
MIDCSHANSQKKHENQILVAKDIAEQLGAGSHEVGPPPLLLFLLFSLQ